MTISGLTCDKLLTNHCTEYTLIKMQVITMSFIFQDGSTAMSIAMEAGHKDIGVLLYARQNIGSVPSGSPVC